MKNIQKKVVKNYSDWWLKRLNIFWFAKENAEKSINLLNYITKLQKPGIYTITCKVPHSKIIASEFFFLNY